MFGSHLHGTVQVSESLYKLLCAMMSQAQASAVMCYFFQAFVTDNGQRVVLPYKCVYCTRPVSTHPLGAIKCLMFVHVGSQD